MPPLLDHAGQFPFTRLNQQLTKRGAPCSITAVAGITKASLAGKTTFASDISAFRRRSWLSTRQRTSIVRLCGSTKSATCRIFALNCSPGYWCTSISQIHPLSNKPDRPRRASNATTDCAADRSRRKAVARPDRRNSVPGVKLCSTSPSPWPRCFHA